MSLGNMEVLLSALLDPSCHHSTIALGWVRGLRGSFIGSSLWQEAPVSRTVNLRLLSPELKQFNSGNWLQLSSAGLRYPYAEKSFSHYFKFEWNMIVVTGFPFDCEPNGILLGS